MKTLPVEIDRKTAVSQSLFVRFGKQRYPVASYEEASRKWNQFRDATGAGASQLPDAHIENAAGEKIARISYNGRVWKNVPEAWQDRSNLLCESVR